MFGVQFESGAASMVSRSKILIFAGVMQVWLRIRNMKAAGSME